MIPDYAYNWIYIITILVLCLFQFIRIRRYSSFGDLYNRTDSVFSSLLLVICFILFFGLRPVSYEFGDMSGYAASYESKIYEVSEIRNEPVWVMIQYICNRLGFSTCFWFLFIAALSIGLKCYGCRKIFKNHIYIAVLFVLSSFSFWGGAVNVIRNNLALSFAFIGVLTFFGNRKSKFGALFLLLLAFYTHTSSFLLIGCFIISYYLMRNIKWCIYVWFVCLLFSLTANSFFENLFISLGFDNRLEGYLTNVDYTGFAHAGFRWDFLLYSIMPIWLGWYVIRQCEVDILYKVLMNTYILTNAFWLLVIRAQFSDRFAAISWSLYPIVIAYPILKFKIWKRQPIKVSNILLIHVLFLLAMKIMYTLRSV